MMCCVYLMRDSRSSLDAVAEPEAFGTIPMVFLRDGRVLIRSPL